MTADEWHDLAAEASNIGGAPLRITPAEYAELVRLRLAHDPLDWADHTTHLDGVPLVVDLYQGAP